MSLRRIVLEPLTRDAFRPFGQVIEAAPAGRIEWINAGDAERHRDLAFADVVESAVEIGVVIARRAAAMPVRIGMLERHPLGTQAFVPLDRQPFLVVVAEDAGGRPDPASIRAFHVTAEQGVNYGRGVWHAPLIALGAGQRFLVIDRAEAGGNLETADLDEAVEVA